MDAVLLLPMPEDVAEESDAFFFCAMARIAIHACARAFCLLHPGALCPQQHIFNRMYAVFKKMQGVSEEQTF